ncbi:hypothetical protein PR202_gb24775 [Eleusine coracana subsp. coracana]|uniref:Malectin-like domain-containing protein n=1 Tax=Eleusine coracana subsp. coracana TaxID=191504 RepID=A0AAV5FNU6_ELECO|nr:hypothetical protein PR202_gb24775 [Eleusine coracana subsp. coracana]
MVMDTRTVKLKLLLGLSVVVWILGTCNADFTPADNYLINCGSTVDATVGRRVFSADNSGETILTSPQSTAVTASLNSVSGLDNGLLYQTARVFAVRSSYSFKIRRQGRHFVRLHFFPFRYQSYDLATSNFKVSTQDVVLLNNFTVPSNSSPVVMEYSLNITKDMLILTFVPLGNSTPFVNAIEVISVPDDLISDSVQTLEPIGQYLGLSVQPMQTFYRVNVGGLKVTADNDTLWRTWVTDQSFFLNSTTTQAVSFPGKLNYQGSAASQEDAPDSVYSTARRLLAQNNTSSNMTWQFNVDGQSSYLIRFHFCDIVSKAAYQLLFDVYVDSLSASKDLDLSTKGFGGTLAVPYFMDIVLESSDPSGKLAISIGPSSLNNVSPDGILNGLEIMKMNISTGSVEIVPPPSAAKQHLAVILGSVLGGVAAILIASVLCIFCRRKKPQPPTRRPSNSWTPLNGLSFLTTGSRTTSRTTLTSGTTTDTSYRIPFVVLHDATNHFDEQMVIGIGGFGKKLTDKSDVYSFGVVLLEVICARPVIDPTLPREMINLAEWAIKWQKRGELEQIVDQRIAGTIRPEALRKYGETVEKCLAEYGVERPTMGDVLWNLEFVLQLQEAGPDISNIDSMNQISELPSNAKRVSSLEISTAGESCTNVDYTDMSTSNAFSQLINAEGR